MIKRVRTESGKRQKDPTSEKQSTRWKFLTIEDRGKEKQLSLVVKRRNFGGAGLESGFVT